MAVLTGSFEDLYEAGCVQAGAGQARNLREARGAHKQAFTDRYSDYSGDICRECPAYNKGRCVAYNKYHETALAAQAKAPKLKLSATTAPGTSQFPGWSVKAIAQALGISQNEVRRRRQDGRL